MDNSKKKEMIYRIAAGLILLPLAIYVVLYANKYVFFSVLQLIILLATKEFILLIKKENSCVNIPLVWISAIGIPCSLFFVNITLFIGVIFLLLFISFLLKMFSDNPVEHVLEDVSYGFLTTIFLPFLFSFMILIRDVEPMWLMFMFFVIWASDTFAYFTGMAIGKHKLIPKVSPKKTIEGLLGGFIGAIIIAFLFNYYHFNLSIIIMAIIAVDVIVAGVIGDLIESMIKRSASVKDSGNLIPGHGGVFDRFDSAILAAPVLYFYIFFLVGI